MSSPKTISNYEANIMMQRKGIFGFGFSNNTNLDMINLVVLAIAGIIVKMFFQENYTKLGTSGPASTTIWGYGLTAISLVLMVFMAIYLTNKEDKQDLLEKNSKDNILLYYLSILSSGTLPIILTLGIVVYIISLNFIYFTRINSNKISSSFSVYSFFSSLLVIIQIGLIIKYMYSILDTITVASSNTKEKQNMQSILIDLNVVNIYLCQK